MIPADIGAALADAVRAAVVAGEWPAVAATIGASGTWRRPIGTRLRPGSYATSFPFAVARAAGLPAEDVAARLAGSLAELSWIAAARPAGGYLNVTVAASHLARLPARVVAAGTSAGCSDALAGVRVSAPGLPDLAAGSNWAQVWHAQHDWLAGRLAAAAGADVSFTPDPSAGMAAGDAGHDSLLAAVARHGSDAVRFALAAAATPVVAEVGEQLARPLDLSNPFVLVRYAHSDAAATLRWAAELGLAPAPPQTSQAARAQDQLEQAEFALIETMSWLPERIAAAARRRRPADLVSYLVLFAGGWLDCAENCAILPFRGRGAAAAGTGSRVAARLELADAARVTLSAGLGLLAVSAPPRI
jgi:arginyl-tRNA synthetase